ncbi:MAG: hypothetical protein FJX11_02060 [Alphaproteobacteria bacterium]|nr:hypothetical protein [Alphaproteobacteria bacterium]
MDKSVAAHFVDAILALERDLTVLDELSHEVADSGERKAIRKSLAQIIVMYTDMLISVIDQHPDLDPDRSDGTVEGNEK